MSTCRTCDAPIRWVRTVRGRAMPLDAEPNRAGNVELDEDGWAIVHGTRAMKPPDAVRYMPHHATCPNWDPT